MRLLLSVECNVDNAFAISQMAEDISKANFQCPSLATSAALSMVCAWIVTNGEIEKISLRTEVHESIIGLRSN